MLIVLLEGYPVQSVSTNIVGSSYGLKGVSIGYYQNIGYIALYLAKCLLALTV